MGYYVVRLAHRTVPFMVLLLLSACASTPKPLTSPVPGKWVETIQSAVAVSIKQGEESKSARGYLIFRRPDRFHLALIAPFGQSLLDVYSDGKSFICLIPVKQTAYRGSLDELPEQDGVRLWGLMSWVVEQPPIANSNSTEQDNVTIDGRREKILYDERGLAVRRIAENGDRVDYRDYGSVDGVPFPMGVELSDRNGIKVSVTFDEPEINRPVEEAVLAPSLDNVTILPFSAFQGF